MSKRIIGFLDMFDEIPNGSKFLYQHLHVVETSPTQEQEAQRLISGRDSVTGSRPIYMNYYEVDEDDIKMLAKNGYFDLEAADKIQNCQGMIEIYKNED